jgi:hypothetical protein
MNDDDDNPRQHDGMADRVRHIELMLRTIQSDVKYLSASMETHLSHSGPMVTQLALLRQEMNDFAAWRKDTEGFTLKMKIAVITAVLGGLGSLAVSVVMALFHKGP